MSRLQGRPDLQSRDHRDAEEDNPFSPEVVFDSFRAGIDEFETSIEVKLIVLKLFDRCALGEMQDVYRELNEFLVSQGVLPEIRPEIRKTQTSGARVDSGALSADTPDSMAADAGRFANGRVDGPGSGRAHGTKRWRFDVPGRGCCR